MTGGRREPTEAELRDPMKYTPDGVRRTDSGEHQIIVCEVGHCGHSLEEKCYRR